MSKKESSASGCLLVILLILGSTLLFSPDDNKAVKNTTDNLTKFNTIRTNLREFGIDTKKLKDNLMKDPLAYRQPVDRHKRKRFMLVTRENEQKISQQVIQEAEKMNLFLNDGAKQKRCDAILEKLAKAAPEGFTPPSKIYILDTQNVNAICLPDGTIIVFNGALEKFNDDELAWIIAHEFSHGTARHGSELISKGLLKDMAIDFLVEKNKDEYTIIGSWLAMGLINLKYNRVQEYEADRLAVFYLNKAGFDLQGAISAIEKFKQNAPKKESAWDQIVSTHPIPEKRLKNIKEAIEKVQKEPDHTWGGIQDDIIEKATVELIKSYIKKQNEEKPQPPEAAPEKK